MCQFLYPTLGSNVLFLLTACLSKMTFVPMLILFSLPGRVTTGGIFFERYGIE